ncbi:Endonuclease/exonuclease/phosphatase [Lipomyces tetrasporus]
MKYSSGIVALCLIASVLGSQIRFQSWNLRYDSKPDSISVAETIASLNATVPYDSEITYYTPSSEVAWSSRRIGVANEFAFNRPDVFCVQEALKRQVYDLAELLPDYAWVGVGRDDGKEAGEYEAIFYRKNSIKLIDWETFWLSDTPFEPSKYPDAGSYRSATVAHLGSKFNNFTAICTHWDDRSDRQRQLAASLLRYRGAYEAETTNAPVSCLVISIRGLPDMLSINRTFESQYKSQLSETFVWKDVLKETPVQNRMGHYATFNGFYDIGNTQAFGRIDFVMAGSNGGWEMSRYKVGEVFYDHGVQLSDHRPCVADVTINKIKK